MDRTIYISKDSIVNNKLYPTDLIVNEDFIVNEQPKINNHGDVVYPVTSLTKKANIHFKQVSQNFVKYEWNILVSLLAQVNRDN